MVDPEVVDLLPRENRVKPKVYIALASVVFGLLGGAFGAGIVWRTLWSKISNLERSVANHEKVVENLRNVHGGIKDPDNYITIKPGDPKPCRPGSVAAGGSIGAQG